MSTTVELHRKDAELQAVRAELVALRARVSALADEWEHEEDPCAPTYVAEMRALITGAES